MKAAKVISEDVKDLFPLTFSRFSYDGPLSWPISFKSFAEFQSFVESLAGNYTVYRAGDRVLVDKYVTNTGMYTVYQSNHVRR